MTKKKEAAPMEAIPLEVLLDSPIFDRHLKAEIRSTSGDPTLVDALLDMTLDLARAGRKFRKGRRVGTVSPIRLAMAKLLLANPRLKNAELWNLLAKNPPRGWTFADNHLGKYLEGPRSKDGMKYGRFCTLASMERKKLLPG